MYAEKISNLSRQPDCKGVLKSFSSNILPGAKWTGEVTGSRSFREHCTGSEKYFALCSKDGKSVLALDFKLWRDAEPFYQCDWHWKVDSVAYGAFHSGDWNGNKLALYLKLNCKYNSTTKKDSCT